MPAMSMHETGNGGNAGNFVRDALDGLRIGPPTTFNRLTVFPLLKSSPVAPPLYLTLAEAIAQGVLRIT